MLESLKVATNAAKVFFVKNSPSILTGLGVAGAIGTAVLAGKTSIAAYKKYEEVKDKDVKEQVKEIAPLYFPVAIMCGVTVACIIGANHENLRRNAALAAAYAMSADDIREYRTKVEEKLGKKKSTDIRDEMALERITKNPPREDLVIATGNGDQLCYDSMSGRYFKSDMEAIRHAVNDLNQELTQNLRMSLNDFYYMLGLPEIVLGRELGWNGASIEGQLNVIFSSQLTPDGKPCLVIEYDVYPIFVDPEVHW